MVMMMVGIMVMVRFRFGLRIGVRMRQCRMGHHQEDDGPSHKGRYERFRSHRSKGSESADNGKMGG